jgi:WhiB family redox-sensing transcriptional regulator
MSFIDGRLATEVASTWRDGSADVSFPGTREVSAVVRTHQQFGVEEASHMQELMDVDDGGAMSWQELALCAQTDPEAFFPEKGGSTREAKKVCLSCDVRGECLEYALSNDERFGIWGGLSERERRKLKKRAV